MERRITEEDVTKYTLDWLSDRGWSIISFDFPQSGTGIVIHPNNRVSKSKGSFIPDIVCYKDGVVLFFENKDRFLLSDFDKVNNIRSTTEYSESIGSLLSVVEYNDLRYGVCIAYSEKALRRSLSYSDNVDFILFLRDDNIEIAFDPYDVFV